ncbi:hypothetical protein [Desulfosudis oleivorans]|uniref:hypothetical protein n=1 Tax=Desulfosudis oleivorans TaxID=181663 RepID=UPI001294682A|nr:hypothetical protein [Desulfosudis oleivorans]
MILERRRIGAQKGWTKSFFVKPRRPMDFDPDPDPDFDLDGRVARVLNSVFKAFG